MKKKKCDTCKVRKDLGEFYVCKTDGVPRRKNSCKHCFNGKKQANARRREFIELTEGIRFKKYEKLKDNAESFSNDPRSAIKERDIKE